ncbi:MAG: hypothetical protein K0Q78_192 [Cellvibrio sp.]|nr:hypothetical protein [Cellvibrio sp.]
MINLIIRDFTGQAYELISRSSSPRSSSAKRYSSDAYLTFRFVATLPLTPDQWVQILTRINQRLPDFHGNHPGEVYEAVAQAVIRGDLSIYRLPTLNVISSLQGKNGFGLCIIKGPKPHSATDLAPEVVTSAAAAQQLLDKLGISPQALLGYLSHQNLYNSYQKQNPLNEALQLLASGELLAYKLPLPPKAPPAKAVEYLPVTAADRPVPLAPESKKSVSVTKVETVPAKKAPPQTLDEATQRLRDAGPAVRAAKANGTALPPSPYTMADKQAVVEKGLEEKFLVRVIETNYAGDEGYIGKIREHGQSISWTAPFSMVEHGDTDAEALLNAFGTRHSPVKNYTILIIDRDKMNDMGDVQTIIPTKQNLKALIAANPKISTLTPDEVEQVLSDDLAPKYYEFAKVKSTRKISTDDMEKMQGLSKEMGFSESETDNLILRQQFADQVAAWEEFTGNGMTLDTNSKAKAYGPVEVVMLDKKPMKLGELRKYKAVKSLNC